MMYKIETVIDNEILSDDYDEATENAINSKNVKLINNHYEFSSEFVCFNYALKNIRDWIHSCEEAYDILKAEYKQINIKMQRKEIIFQIKK